MDNEIVGTEYLGVAGMVSRGEVALIIVAIGLDSGLLDPTYFTPLLKLAFGGKRLPEE